MMKIISAVAMVVAGGFALYMGFFALNAGDRANTLASVIEGENLGGVTNLSGMAIGDDGLDVNGLTTLATTTVETTLILDDATFCVDFYATSTDTRVHMTASSTATIEGTDGVIMFEYGGC